MSRHQCVGLLTLLGDLLVIDELILDSESRGLLLCVLQAVVLMFIHEQTL